MNISHTYNQQNDVDEGEDISAIFTKNVKTKSQDSSAKNDKLSMIKVFELLDDSTANYVLGYN